MPERYLQGLSIVADRWSVPMYGYFDFDGEEGFREFRERIAPGAWSRLADDLKLTVNHWEEVGSILARSATGNLETFETDRGLEFTAEIGTAQILEDTYRQVMERNVSKMSFMFYDDGSTKSEWGVGDDGMIERTITELGHIEHLAAVVNPAYPDTELTVAESMRSAADEEARAVIAEYEARRAARAA